MSGNLKIARRDRSKSFFLRIRPGELRSIADFLMCGGAVNRQPGDRARNLQRRGYRAPPPRSKIFSGARRHHDRKFSPDFFFFYTRATDRLLGTAVGPKKTRISLVRKDPNDDYLGNVTF